MIVSQTEFLTLTSVEDATLEYWLDEEWLLPKGLRGKLYFSDIDVARAQLILTLSGDFGVNTEGLGIILHLLDQIHSLRAAVSASLAGDNPPNSES